MVKKTVTIEFEDQFDAEDAPSVKATVSFADGKSTIFIRKTATGSGVWLSLDQFERVAKFVENCRMEEDASE